MSGDATWVIVADNDLLKDKSKWSDGKACMACNEKYTLLKRSHHCRICGQSYCDSCSPRNAKVSALSKDAHRICSSCYKIKVVEAEELVKLQEAAELEMEADEDLDNADEEAKLNMPKVHYPGSSNVVRLARTTKLGMMLLPILNNYRHASKRVTKLEKNSSSEEAFLKGRRQIMDAAHAKEAKAMKKLLVSMGGLYNKGAQLIAAAPMVLPPEIVDELQSCFEDMPAREWKVVRRIIYSGMGGGDKKVGEAKVVKEFKEIKEKPLAAASIGQVHTGTLHSGKKVVVKVLYPEIRKNMSADLASIKASVSMIVSMLDLKDMRGIIDLLYKELSYNFPRELDFHIELAQMEYARKLLKKHSKTIYVPLSYPDLSGAAILTQEMIQGKTINSIAKDGTDAEKVAARKALSEVIDAQGIMCLRDGFFHADPHPGNVMVLDSGRPAMIDWGQCMNLSRAQRRRLCQMVILLRTRAVDLVLAGLNASGFEFPSDPSGQIAAMIFFAFDSAINSPFTKDIDELGDTIRNAPQKLQLPTKAPREVIFFARVMQCLRRNCDLLNVDISAIERWAPIAREELRKIVMEGPIERRLSAAPEDDSAKFFDEDPDEDDSSMWAPSRLLTILDFAKFDQITRGVRWAQDHPAEVDLMMEWNAKVPTFVYGMGLWVVPKVLAKPGMSVGAVIFLILLLERLVYFLIGGSFGMLFGSGGAEL